MAQDRLHPAIVAVLMVLGNHCIHLLQSLTRRVIFVTLRGDCVAVLLKLSVPTFMFRIPTFLGLRRVNRLLLLLIDFL